MGFFERVGTGAWVYGIRTRLQHHGAWGFLSSAFFGSDLGTGHNIQGTGIASASAWAFLGVRSAGAFAAAVLVWDVVLVSLRLGGISGLGLA